MDTSSAIEERGQAAHNELEMQALEALQALTRDGALPGIHQLLRQNRHRWCEHAVSAIAAWRTTEDLAALIEQFQELGREAHRIGIPDTELARAIHVVVDICRGWESFEGVVRSQAHGAELPIRSLSTLPELAVYYAIRGYEDDLR